jgi:cytochrome c oxidase subunit 2
MNKLIGLIVIGLVLVGGIMLFNKNKMAKKEETAKQITQMAPSTAASNTTSSTVKEFTMTAKRWAFDPGVITVKQGDKVRLKITSIDVTHGFALPDFDVKIDLVPNQEQTVEFTADKKGEFTFFCSVMCGAGHQDMKGKLVVE